MKYLFICNHIIKFLLMCNLVNFFTSLISTLCCFNSFSWDKYYIIDCSFWTIWIHFHLRVPISFLHYLKCWFWCVLPFLLSIDLFHIIFSNALWQIWFVPLYCCSSIVSPKSDSGGLGLCLWPKWNLHWLGYQN